MKQAVRQVFLTSLAIMVTGYILDELGSGKLGAAGATIAKKVTKGYGV